MLNLIKSFFELSSVIGINDNALSQACDKVQNLKLLCNFPNGVVDIVFSIETHLDESLYDIDLSNKKGITKKISFLVFQRMSSYMEIPHYRGYLREFLKSKIGLSCMIATVDCIWRRIGDDSTDFNFYTKRAILFSVYVPSLYYFIHDFSMDAKSSEQFIDKSLAKVSRIGKLKKELKNLLGFLQ